MDVTDSDGCHGADSSALSLLGLPPETDGGVEEGPARKRLFAARGLLFRGALPVIDGRFSDGAGGALFSLWDRSWGLGVLKGGNPPASRAGA